MRTELLEVVVQVITAHCYWMRVAAVTEYHPYAIVRDDHLLTRACRHLTLEVTHSRGHYYTGHRWQVCETELDQVLSLMRKSTPSLQHRCHNKALTAEDVETLILRASYGIIQLDMVEDDYTPPAFIPHNNKNRINTPTNFPQ